jgi:hypothetical protein
LSSDALASDPVGGVVPDTEAARDAATDETSESLPDAGRDWTALGFPDTTRVSGDTAMN